MPTKVEEARTYVNRFCTCDAMHGKTCYLHHYLTEFESAIREEERGKRNPDRCDCSFDYTDEPVPTMKVLKTCAYHNKAIRDERAKFTAEVRALKAFLTTMKDSGIDEAVAWAQSRIRHGQARAEGASEMYSCAQGHAHKGKAAAIACQMKEPEPGGGRCPECGQKYGTCSCLR